LYALLSLCCGLGGGITRAGALWGFSRLLWGLKLWDPRSEGSDDTSVLAVGFFQGPHTILQLGYQGVRTVVRLVTGRTRLVGGRTILCRPFKQHVDLAIFPFYRECASTYATTNGLGADTKNSGGLGHGRTAFGRRTVLSHGPMLYPSEAPRKPLEAILVALVGIHRQFIARC
jgi:hypothetical protein